MSDYAVRDHETPEQKLVELMAQDKKARTIHDRLVGELTAVRQELEQIATKKVELMAQLGSLYKKQANGKGKSV